MNNIFEPGNLISTDSVTSGVFFLLYQHYLGVWCLQCYEGSRYRYYPLATFSQFDIDAWIIQA